MLVCVSVCVLSDFGPVWLFATLWTVTHQVSLSIGFSTQKYWSRLPCPPPGDLPKPWIKPVSPALQVDSLPTEPPGKPRAHALQQENPLQCEACTLQGRVAPHPSSQLEKVRVQQ